MQMHAQPGLFGLERTARRDIVAYQVYTRTNVLEAAFAPVTTQSRHNRGAIDSSQARSIIGCHLAPTASYSKQQQ